MKLNFIILLYLLIYKCLYYLNIFCTSSTLYKIDNFDCEYNFNSCKLPNAYCNNKENICYCSSGYINQYFNNKSSKNNKYNKNNIDNVYCSYSQKKQLNAFVLELIFPIGGGHFYIKNYLFGFLKLMLYLLMCVLGCFRISFKGKEYRNQIIFIKISSTLVVIGLITWTIFDLIYFGLNMYKDNNNMPLLSW